MKKKITSIALVLCMLLSCVSVGCFTSNAAAKNDASVSASSTSSSVGANDYGLADNIQNGTILHCFDWKYNDIKAELPNIAEAGFTSIQTSPAQPQVTSGKWYWLYQPLGFYIGTNDLGTKAELQSLCTEAEKYGINVVVDVVANHFASDHSNIQNDLKDSQYWHQESGGIDYVVRSQIHQRSIGMPDINSEHSYVQQSVRKYVDELASIGVDGIRWDAAKHIALPSENCNFWPTVTQGTGLWNYGEILDDPVASDSNRGIDNSAYAESLMKEYTNYISVTDSTYSANVRKALKNGNISGSIGNYSERGVAKNKLVYWAESHDTFSNNGSGDDASQYIDQNKIDRAYAIVASQNNATALYFSRPSSTDKETIMAGQKGSTHFTSPEVAAVNHFHNAMVGQKEYYVADTGNNVAAVCREEGAVIVLGSGSNRSVSVANGGSMTKPGTYVDEITGNTFTVTSTTISGQVGSSGIAVVYNPEKKPSASVTPGTSTYKTDTLTLTLNYSNATSGQYSIDGGAYQNFTNGQTITIGSGLAYGTTTTVSVKASDGTNTSDVKSYTYTKKDPNSVQTVYFDNSNYNWSNVYAYIYTDETENAEWPGVQMTKGSDNIYSVEVPEDLSNGYVIFAESSTSSNRSTPDGEDGLTLNGKNMIFRYSGVWEEYNQQPTTEPTEPETKPTTPTKPTEKVLLGDVDLNNNINVNDVTAVQKYISGALTLSTKAQTATDVNRDGIISIKDATCIQFYILGVDGNTGSTGEYIGGETQPTTSAEQPTTSPESYVYFKNTSNWNNVNAYYWSVENTTMTQWPGVAMESVGDNTYRLKYPEGATYIIFNNGSSQTDDIKLEGANKIYNNGSWSNYN